MKKKNETDSLNDSITLLENKRAQGLQSLKEQFDIVHESLKPINLLKSTFQEVTSSPEIKTDLVNSAIGITTGYLARKILFRASGSPVKKVIGSLFQFAVTNFVSKHSDVIRSTGENIIHRALSHRKGKKEFQTNGKGYM